MSEEESEDFGDVELVVQSKLLLAVTAGEIRLSKPRTFCTLMMITNLRYQAAI